MILRYFKQFELGYVKNLADKYYFRILLKNVSVLDTSTLDYIPYYNHLKILIFLKIKLNQMKELYVMLK